MWVRMRLDIGWRDVFAALSYCCMPGDRLAADGRARQTWSTEDDFLIALSVRSAFDMMLRALQLPAGSEVLLSALTVPDMARIVELHGLVPVPVDTDGDGVLCLDSFRKAISPKTRMLVVAHLFGGANKLDEVRRLAVEHDVMVVEDCAQGYRRVGDSGQASSDASMFSFGPIKTASALGGAVVRVSSPELCRRMHELLRNDPVQRRVTFGRRIVRFAMLKALSGNRRALVFRRVVEMLGYDYDTLVNSVARGFSASDLAPQIRRQPSTPLLSLLRRRWRTYDHARIERRIQLGRRLDKRLGLSHPANHTFWVYPVFVDDPIGLCEQLQAAGFDATRQSRMVVVPAVDRARQSRSAQRCWERVVFLPWYPELADVAVDRMAEIIRPYCETSTVDAERSSDLQPAKSNKVLLGPAEHSSGG